MLGRYFRYTHRTQLSYTMKKNLVLLVLALSPLFGFGQGMIFNEETFYRLPKAPTSDGSKSLKNLPFKIDLSPFTPPIFTQKKDELTCVAVNTSYYAFPIQRAAKRAKIRPYQNPKEFALSPIYSYSKIVPKCNNGLDFDTVAKQLKKFGGIPFSELDASSCKDGRVPVALKKSYEFIKIKEVQAVFPKGKKDTVLSIYDFKKHLSDSIPIIIGLPLHDNFTKLNKQKSLYKPTGSQMITYINGEPVALNHVVTMVGYDDELERFKMVNCYGEGWGDNGYFYMSYEDFEKSCKGAFIMQLYPETFNGNTAFKIGGQFDFRRVTGVRDGMAITESEKPIYTKDGMYVLAKKDWKRGQRFQLYAQNSVQGEYMSVFSINENNEINVHWPVSVESESFSSKSLSEMKSIYGAWNVSDLVSSSSQLVIPGTGSALTINETGKDYLCILYGKNSIQSELIDIIAKLRNTSNQLSIPLRLRQALGSRAVTSGVTYSPDQMHFEATPQQGDIVPIILEVISK